MTIDEIRDNFTLLDDWDDRYRYVIELGRTLEPMPEADHSLANKVQGCASQVWLSKRVERGGGQEAVLKYLGDSDAHIVRGLIAILLTLYSGARPQEILATDAPAVFDEFGFRDHLTPQRSNGLRSMVERIRTDRARERARPAARLKTGVRMAYQLFPPPTLLPKPHLLGKLRARHRIVRRHHRIVGRQAPFVAVLFRGHVVLRAQMPLQRLEAFAVLQTHQIVGVDRFLQRHGRLARLRRSLAPSARDPKQGRVNLADQVRDFGRRRRIVAEIGRHDVRGQIDEALAGGIRHEPSLSRIAITHAFLRIRTVSSGANTLARIPTSIEYELITADAQEQRCSRPGSIKVQPVRDAIGLG